MTFHESVSLKIAPNSMELLRTYSFPIMITSSSMDFHGIPWNCSCHRNWRIPSSMEFSMEFHGTARVIEIGAPQAPWNSMGCANFDDTTSSMEFHRNSHGTWSAPISMARAVPWNSMAFHGTWSGPISMTRTVTWNSMEFHGTWSAPMLMTIPWNSMELGCAIFMQKIIFRSSFVTDVGQEH